MEKARLPRYVNSTKQTEMWKGSFCIFVEDIFQIILKAFIIFAEYLEYFSPCVPRFKCSSFIVDIVHNTQPTMGVIYSVKYLLNKMNKI